jgi:hypothetical protein
LAFEYHKSALCILKQRPLIKGHVLTNPIKPVIKPSNPGTPAKEADLSNCNYVYVVMVMVYQYLHIYLMVIWHKIN